MSIKPLLALPLSAALTLSGIPAVSAAAETPDAAPADVLIGDVDADGVIGIADATALQLFLAQDAPLSSTEQLHVMDADGSGSVTISDATELQRFIAELPHSDLIGRSVGAVYPPQTPAVLSLNAKEITLGSTETFLLEVSADAPLTVSPEFSSDDPSVAAVSAAGVITAGQAGQATVTCVCGDLAAACTVTVLPLAQTLAFSRLTLSLTTGEDSPLTVHLPSGTASYHRRFFSEDPAVAVVDDDGVVTAVSSGSVRIGCELSSGARAYLTVTVLHPVRVAMLAYLQEQLGNDDRRYIEYINAHSDLNVWEHFPWCAVFAWSTLDSFAVSAGLSNPVQPGKQVSNLANQARGLGALHNVFDNDYTPKPGDLFTTSTLSRPVDDGREHIGYIESVDYDATGKVIRVHTIEGNYDWEIKYPEETRVSRGEWVPGVRNRFDAALVEFIDLEKLLLP